MTNNTNISAATHKHTAGNSTSAPPASSKIDARVSRDPSDVEKSYRVMLMCLLPQTAKDLLAGSCCPFSSGQYTEF